jgi:ribosome recycling factor
MLTTAEQRMKRTIQAMERDLQRFRIGAASASLVDAIHVNHKGRRTRLVELASITVPDPRQIVIRPWDPTSLRAMGTAISQSRIGLTPTIDGPVIRVYVPAMTGERRLELLKLVRKRLDQARVEIRAVRHETLPALRVRDARADDIRREIALLQRMTDRFSDEIDRLGHLKEASILGE